MIRNLPLNRLAPSAIAMFSIVFLFALVAFGQDTQVLTPPPLELDPHNTALQLIDAIKNGQWWLVVGLGVSLLTWLIRRGIFAKLPWPTAQKWLLDHPIVGLLTPFVLSAIGGIATTFASGMPFTWGTLVGEILKVGMAAVVAFIAAKKVQESVGFGQTEAAKVDTLQKANDGLLKP